MSRASGVEKEAKSNTGRCEAGGVVEERVEEVTGVELQRMPATPFHQHDR